MEYLSPKLDIVFKTMFSDKNNTDMLRGLLKAYLDIDEEGTYTLSNTEITPEELDRKFARLDLRITTGQHEIDVEIQLLNKKDFVERSIYYWASLFTSTVKRGEKYNGAKSTMSLNILDFRLFQDCEDFNTNFTFYDPDHNLALSDKVRIGFVELPKIREYTPEQLKSDERVAWAAFFNAKREEEFNMLSQTTANPDVKKAVTVIRELSADERLREQARKRQEALFDEQSALKAERAEGRAEGVDDLANALLRLGVNKEKIEEAVRLLQTPQSPQEADTNEDSDDWDMNR